MKPDPRHITTDANFESTSRDGPLTFLEDRKPRTRVYGRLLFAAVVYVVIAAAVYRFNHPELTETELFLHLIDAIAWQ